MNDEYSVLQAVSDGGMEAVGDMLDELTASGLTQVEIADRLGTYQYLVSNWMRGKTTPSRRYRAEITSLYQQEIDRWTTESDRSGGDS